MALLGPRRRPATVAAGPFDFAGDRRGILLVHGFTGTPFEMRLLGEALARRGFTVAGPRLAGHGGDAATLAATTWHDWYLSVERAWDELRGRCDRGAVCGLSLGGLLSFELARRRREQVAAVAALATPLWISSWQSRAVRLLARAPGFVDLALPKLAGSDLRDREMWAQNPTFDRFPVRALRSLLECMDHTTRRLPEIDRPTLLAHSRGDRTAPFACRDAIADRLAGPVERVTLERSRHVITLDVERDLLFRRLGDFYERHLPP